MTPSQSFLQVAASEYELLRLVQDLISPVNTGHIDNVLGRALDMPAKIGPAASKALNSILRQVWPALWRHNTAISGSISNNKVIYGRGWQRYPAESLTFSDNTIKFLLWLLDNNISHNKVDTMVITRSAVTVGDQVIVYLVLNATKDIKMRRTIASQPLALRSGLVWLGFPELMMESRGDFKPTLFDDLTTGVGAMVIEALTPRLASHWHALEMSKRAMTKPTDVIELGRTQEMVSNHFMDICNQIGRRDLTRFILEAAAPMLAKNLSPKPQSLDAESSLLDRTTAKSQAGTLLRAVRTWNQWDQQHRGVRFIDDNYDVSQYLLKVFEIVGQAGSDRAEAMLSDLTALN